MSRKSFKKSILCTLAGLAVLISSAWAGDHQVNVTVKGMVCAFCAQGITKKFSADPAVSHVDVSLEKHLVTLALKDKQTLQDEKIMSVLKDAGYTVEKIERH